MNKNRGLKNRKTISNAVRSDLVDSLKELSYESRVPMSKLLDEAIQLLLEKRELSK